MGYKMKQGRRINFRKLLLQETLGKLLLQGSDTVDSPDSIQTLKDLMDDRDAWITHCKGRWRALTCLWRARPGRRCGRGGRGLVAGCRSPPQPLSGGPARSPQMVPVTT